jgi:hypothetical protein
MDFINVENLKAYWHLWILGSIILILIGYFFFKFFIPSQRLEKHLGQAIRKLQNITGKSKAIDIIQIGNEIMTFPKLNHCWIEFAETLHPQTAPDELGQERVVCWRSTVPAEVFFNVETLVAVELKTEYFKHQPGILTGIGIIGTFAGLLRGLSTFSVSSNPETVRLSLDALIHGVVEAFAVSASAITLAMITTFLEKLIVTRRIKQVEELCQLLDGLFVSGAGEEYLSRLVKAGESSATQTAQLKDALVTDLKEMLEKMTQQQTEAIAASFATSSENSGNRIAQAISDSLSEPLQKIASAVNTTTDTNGEVVTRALNEALVTFSEQMKDMFGGQMGDINQLLQQTTTAMQSTVARFDQLANSLGDAGKNAADVMSERLSAALESMEARQHALNTTMSEFVSQLREMVQSSQSETNDQLQKTLALLGDQVAAMTDQLQQQAQSAADTHQNQQDKLQQNASALNQELATQVQTSMTAMQQQLAGMIEVMKEQSAQTATLNAEQHKTLSQHTQSTVEALAGRMQSSMATIDEQATAAQAVVQQQLQVMVDALKENAVQAASAQNGQQRRFFENMQTTLVSINEKVENTVNSLNKTVTDFVDLMTQQAQQSTQSHQTTQQQLAEQANRLVEQLSLQVQAMTAQTNEAAKSMQTAVAAMRDVTKDNTQRMENSAGTLSLAADNFAKAGNSVAGVIQQTGTVTDKMATTSIALNTAAVTVQTALIDYNTAGKVMSEMVEALKATVEAAKKDATVSQTLVNQIKQSAEQLQQAQSSVDGIFKTVCEELANAHEEFASNVVKGLKSSNTAYQKELKDAVDYLKTAIEELGEVADNIADRR